MTRYLNIYEKVDGGERFVRCMHQQEEDLDDEVFQQFAEYIDHENDFRRKYDDGEVNLLEIRNEGFMGHSENDTAPDASELFAREIRKSPEWRRRNIVTELVNNVGGIVDRAIWELEGLGEDGYHENVVALGDDLAKALKKEAAAYFAKVAAEEAKAGK